MKTKFLFLLAAVLFIANQSNAQENAAKNYDQKFRLGFGLNAGIPTSDPYDFALGGDVRLQYDLTKRYSLTLTTGFTNLFISGNDNDLGFIPVKAGFKAFIWKEQFYLMGEAGVAFPVTHDYNDNSIIIAPSLGYATKYFDVSLRYEHYSDFPTVNNDGGLGSGVGQFAVRFAYAFVL